MSQDFRRLRHSENFTRAVGVDAHGDYDGSRHDTAGVAHFHVRRIDPHIRPVASDRPVQEYARVTCPGRVQGRVNGEDPRLMIGWCGGPRLCCILRTAARRNWLMLTHIVSFENIEADRR
jgi:hypothetical protein